MSWPMRERTGRHLQVLDFIRWHIKEHGYAPSIREICQGMGFSSTSTAHYHLTNLAKEGRIEWGAGRNRSIRLVTKHGPCPTCGHDPVQPLSRLNGTP